MPIHTDFNLVEAAAALELTPTESPHAQTLPKIAVWLRQLAAPPLGADSALDVLAGLRNPMRNTLQMPGLQPRVLITVQGGVADYVSDSGVDIEIFDHDNYEQDPDGTSGVPGHFADLLPPSSDIPVEPGSAQATNTPEAQAVALAQLQYALRLATDTGLLDVLADDVHPDVINKFCDVVSDEWAARQPDTADALPHFREK